MNTGPMRTHGRYPLVGAGPFVGTGPFLPGDFGHFFGRAREIGELTGLWTRHRLTILYGDSGVGKTSLLQAGVVPRLESMEADVLPVGRIAYPTTFPRAAASEANPYTFALLSSWLPGEPPARVSGLSIGEFLRRRERTGRLDRPAPTLVVIDQFEDVFQRTGPRDHQRYDFVAELADALADRPRTHLLTCVRADRFDDMRQVAKTLGSGEAFASFRLGPLDREAAIEAVTRPLGQAGRVFEPGGAERLVDELRTVRPPGTPEEVAPSVEPVLLQVVCCRLWERLTGNDPLIQATKIPDVDQALAGFCSEALAATAAGHDISAHDLRGWLRDAFVTPLGADAAVREGVETTLGMANSILRSIEDHHLIRRLRRDGVHCYQLQHRRLIQPIQRLEGTHITPRQTDSAARLQAAETAMSQGELGLAQRHALAARRADGRRGMRIRAESESLLGDVAYEQGRADTAVRHYRSAARMFETLLDGPAVGRLLAAIGRLELAEGDTAAAIDSLRAAARRVPGDLMVQIWLGRALWYAGQSKAALAVLNGVLSRDGDTPEALRLRGEILTDLGEADSSRDIAD